MSTFYDVHAGKRATNVTVNEDLLRQARELEINLSGALEERLVEVVAQKLRERWSVENAQAITDYNERMLVAGPYSEGLRRF